MLSPSAANIKLPPNIKMVSGLMVGYDPATKVGLIATQMIKMPVRDDKSIQAIVVQIIYLYYDGNERKGRQSNYLVFIESESEDFKFLKYNDLIITADNQKIVVGKARRTARKTEYGVKEGLEYEIKKSAFTKIANAKNLEIKLIGKISQEVLDTILNYKLNDFVNNLGYVSHQEAIENQQKSQVLLLIEIDSEDTKSIIPGKLFEYMVSDRPIIGIGPKNSDFQEILVNTNSGLFFEYSEKENLKKSILEYYNLYLNKNLKSNAINLEQYSRKNLTAKLVEFLNPSTALGRTNPII